MQRWEYLEVFLNYSWAKWHDSTGRQGELVTGAKITDIHWWQHSGPLLNELGREGWELVGVESHTGSNDGAKWIFKRTAA